MNNADIFFSNRRHGYHERYGLTADELCSKHLRLIHAKVSLYGVVVHGQIGLYLTLVILVGDNTSRVDIILNVEI